MREHAEKEKAEKEALRKEKEERGSELSSISSIFDDKDDLSPSKTD